ncbi:MAG: PAS domain-containing protein, partial [Planctomycetes bacterium]|nr:PAS domain-containing protein [Planctomycetota bacterium]
FHAIGHPALILNAERTILAANQAVSKLIGKPSSEIVGRPCFEVFHDPGGEGPPPDCPVGRLSAGAGLQTGEMEMRTLGGVFLVSCTPVLDSQGRLQKIIHIATDITQRRSAEKALRESEERYRELVERQSEGIGIVDSEERFLFANPAADDIFGVPAGTLTGRTLAEFTDPEEMDLIRKKTDERKAGRRDYYELWIRRPGGEKRLLLVSAVPRTGPDGGYTGAFGVFRDVTDMRRAQTERARLELQLRQTQKMEAIGHLAGGIAHDFNNLLTVINGFSDLLLVRIPPDGPHRREIAEIRKAGESAAALTSQLLGFCRSRPTETRAMNPAKTLSAMQGMLRRLIVDPVDLRIAADPACGEILGDPASFEQVVVNLALNARDAMPAGGRLTVELSPVVLDEAFVRNHFGARRGPHVRLAVEDTGIGMTEETRLRIFEPFFTTKKEGKGTGLGLFVVYGVVRQFGGTVWVSSEPRKGTRFELFFPVAEGPERAEDREAEASEEGFSGVKVLLVEDEDPVRQVVRSMLESLGLEVLEAASADEATQVGKRYGGAVQVLLTDIVMPGRNGYQAAEEISRAHPGIRVVFMSGYADVDPESSCGPGTGRQFLRKPFTRSQLARKLRDALTL